VTILASDTEPVREMIADGQNGLLVDFFDVDAMVQAANRVLDALREFKHLGAAGIDLIRERYSLEVCLPQVLELFEDALHRS
jgi:glycosyltransferase involved in cell wall biosynthesis